MSGASVWKATWHRCASFPAASVTASGRHRCRRSLSPQLFPAPAPLAVVAAVLEFFVG